MLFWIIVAALIFVLFQVKSLRQQWVTGPAFKLFKKVLPPLSQTEREAMEAGSVWVEGDLFSGKPDWERLYSMALPQLTDEEQSFLDNEVNELMGMINDFDVIHKDKDFTEDAWAEAGRNVEDYKAWVTAQAPDSWIDTCLARALHTCFAKS